MAKLSELLQQTKNAAIEQTMAASQSKITPGMTPVVLPPRSLTPPTDVYDQYTEVNMPFLGFSPGTRRTLWSIPDVSVTQTPVSTLQTSGVTSSTQSAQIIGGAASNVKAFNSVWSAVPNLQLVTKVTGPVHLTANLSVQSNTANDTVSFAFYRDGVQLSQIFQQTMSNSANSPSLINLSFIEDPNTTKSFLTNHTYAVYWKGGTGQLSASTTQRSMFGINLTPQ